MIKTGYFQFDPSFMEREKNYQKIINRLGSAEADLIVLPELAVTGYNFESKKQLMDISEDPDKSDGIKELIRLSGERDMGIVLGFAEKEGNKVFNSALLITREGIAARYRKIHLFFKEKLFFERGNLPLDIYIYKNVHLGMMICFDWFFPEVTRSYALRGTHMICHPSNLVLNYCQQVMIGRSIENLVYVVTANRIGHESSAHGNFTFTGQSQIVAPKGKLLHRGPESKEELFITELDPLLAENKYITETNHMLADRRPEFYFKD